MTSALTKTAKAEPSVFYLAEDGVLYRLDGDGRIAPEGDLPESSGPYTCKSCLTGTWNDDDLCDDCAEQGRLEAQGDPNNVG